MNIKNSENIKKEIEGFKNRIVRTEKDVDPNTLNLNPYNFKLHQQPQIDTMNDILDELGFIGAILAVEKNRNVIDGHMRVKIYRDSGQLIPLVIFLDFQTEEEEKKAILLFDQISRMSRTDRETLTKVINEIEFKKQKTRDLIKKLGKKKKIDVSIDDKGKTEAVIQKDDGDKEEVEDMFNKLIEKWDVADHMIWQFGEKWYVIKGDSTSEEVIKHIKIYKPDCINTDPPYGIDVVGSDGRIGLAKHYGDVPGDTKPFDPQNILDWHLPSIIWGANHFSSKMPDFPQLLIWYKKGVGNESNDFADAEIAWHSEKGAIRAFDHVWRGAARASERGVPRWHPTQKPIALFDWCIAEFLLWKDKKEKIRRNMVLDLYGGAGTTIVSAYGFGLGAISVEIDERYVAATLERLYNLSGRKIKPQVLL